MMIFHDLVRYISDWIASLVAFVLIYLMVGVGAWLVMNLLRLMGMNSKVMRDMSRADTILYSPFVLMYVIAPIAGLYCLYMLFFGI